MLNHSVVSDSLRLQGLWSASLLCPWDSPGKNTRVGSHFLLQGILLNHGSNLSTFFFFGYMACGILVPQPGNELVTLAMEAWSLNHWTTRKAPNSVA